jgi:hypothetical protein
MSLIATGSTAAAAAEPIENNGFWPDIDPAHFREAQRVDSTVTAARVRDALLAGIVDANLQLREWQASQEEAGHATAADVPAPAWQPAGITPALYRRAVYALAKANLVERYLDYDSTGAAVERAEELGEVIADYRRDAAWAIADIAGRRRTTVELI